VATDKAGSASFKDTLRFSFNCSSPRCSISIGLYVAGEPVPTTSRPFSTRCVRKHVLSGRSRPPGVAANIAAGDHTMTISWKTTAGNVTSLRVSEANGRGDAHRRGMK
jgi:hypothetical protein